MRDMYLRKAERCDRSARINARLGWFYVALVVVNVGLGVHQAVNGQPPISFIVAVVMVGIVGMNVNTVRSYRRSADGYRRHAERARR